MAESDSSNSSSSLFSLNSLMTVITLVGGIILASHQLSSTRPQKTANEGTYPPGNQNIESRLWEDPFAGWNKLTAGERKEYRKRGLADLVKIVGELTSPTASPHPTLLVLGVMVPGQPYAEDRESCIRARFAVGAALGVAGYKPEDAEHMGLAACPWPSSDELKAWKKNPKARLGIAYGSKKESNYCSAERTELSLSVPFEIYGDRRYFPGDEYPHQSTQPNEKYKRILLLWLDEEYFDDDPASRLALVLNSLRPSKESATTLPKIDWAIIGPRSSQTLRMLVTTSYKPDQILTPNKSDLWQVDVRDTLKPAD